MRNLILVAFIEPVTDGLVFPRDNWPLHITLVKFDVDVMNDVKFDVGGGQGAYLAIGADAGFGRRESVPVSLVEPSRPLQKLHESLVGAVAELPGREPAPHHTLENYRPHVSHHGDKRTRPGDVVVLDRVALVDMAPDGNHSVRRILHLWELTK